jgi:hypothetical protein
MALKVTDTTGSGPASAAIGIRADATKPNFGLPNVSTKNGKGGFTMMWSTYSVSSHNFDTIFWYAVGDGTVPGINAGNFGCAHFENPPSSGNWFYEIGNGNDFIGTTLIQNGRWYRQAIRRREYPDTHYEYYTDLPSLTSIVASPDPADPMTVDSRYHLRFGDNAWAQESLNGYVDAVKIWEEYLPLGAIIAESYSRWPVCREFAHPQILYGCWPFLHYGNTRDFGARGNHMRVLSDVGAHLSEVSGAPLSHTMPRNRVHLALAPTSDILLGQGLF